MKFLKYSLVILVVALITDAAIVAAGVPTYNIIYELDGGNVQKTNYHVKDTWTPQKYYNQNTSTWLNDPCNTCEIVSKPGTSSGDIGKGEVTTRGQTKVMNNPTSLSYPDTYRLNIWRKDVTLLSTHHVGVWTLN